MFIVDMFVVGYWSMSQDIFLFIIVLFLPKDKYPNNGYRQCIMNFSNLNN